MRSCNILPAVRRYLFAIGVGHCGPVPEARSLCVLPHGLRRINTIYVDASQGWNLFALFTHLV